MKPKRSFDSMSHPRRCDSSSAVKFEVLLCNKYRHIPSYGLPFLVATSKNKEIKGHFNGPLPQEYDSTEICIFRDIHILPRHVLSATTEVLVTIIERQPILILLARNYEVGGLGS
jgi:hypothetical protein